MRMLLAKVIARLRLRLGVGEDSLQLLDERLQILAGKFPAEPKHETWYVAHGGDFSNLAGSLHDEMGKRDFTAFLRGRQVPLTPFHRPPRDADQLNLHMWPTDRKKREKAKILVSPAHSNRYRQRNGKSLTEPSKQKRC